MSIGEGHVARGLSVKRFMKVGAACQTEGWVPSVDLLGRGYTPIHIEEVVFTKDDKLGGVSDQFRIVANVVGVWIDK